ncbi:hypothetical protein [Burkholderia ubonensis]|uniref:hypothetical protein n=1 Tax=Burkholderia ubonensis TaxID=101571 RepID=UPI0007538B61|nr:hypothetical protein [Burkholderia ubonensis]KVQ06863.1 hypothetical protein WK00_08955 [Burkholderia ubonensis]
MTKQFKVGQKVKVSKKVDARYGEPFPWLDCMDSAIGAIGTITGTNTFNAGEAYAVDFDGDTSMDAYYLPESLEPIEEPRFKVGDKVRNVSDTGMKDYGLKVGEVYTVAKVRDNFTSFGRICGDRHCIQLAELLDACSTHHRYESQYELVEEPATEFRIRKHGTALREVRGTPFATQQEAEQAVSRYTPGSVYEIVEVKVVRTVKVEQEVRVIDYKEAA